MNVGTIVVYTNPRSGKTFKATVVETAPIEVKIDLREHNQPGPCMQDGLLAVFWTSLSTVKEVPSESS